MVSAPPRMTIKISAAANGARSTPPVLSTAADGCCSGAASARTGGGSSIRDAGAGSLIAGACVAANDFGGVRPTRRNGPVARTRAIGCTRYARCTLRCFALGRCDRRRRLFGGRLLNTWLVNQLGARVRGRRLHAGRFVRFDVCRRRLFSWRGRYGLLAFIVEIPALALNCAVRLIVPMLACRRRAFWLGQTFVGGRRGAGRCRHESDACEHCCNEKNPVPHDDPSNRIRIAERGVLLARLVLP